MQPDVNVSSMDVIVFVLVSCYFIAVFNTAKCVVFEINDYDFNRVVLVGETDIVMTCSAPELNDPQFVISHQPNITIDSQNNFTITMFAKSIVVRITQVQAFHSGLYQCLVTGDGSMTLTNLTLDVRSGSGRFCPQSSETLNVNEGESFTLFCYFLWSAPVGVFTPFDYIWKEKSEPNPILLNSTVTQSPGFNKGIVVAVVGPFTADDDDTVYECSHLMQSITGTQPCSVGPVNVTPRQTDPTSQTPTQQPVTVPATSTPIRLSTKTSAPSTTTTYQKTLNVTIGPGDKTPTSSSSSPPSSSSSSPPPSPLVRKDITEEPMTTTSGPDNSSATIIILSCVAVIILVIFIAILLCLVFLCKGKSKKRDKEKSDLEMTRHPVSHSNNGYLEPRAVTGSSSGNARSAAGSSSMPGRVYDNNNRKEQLQANEYQLSDSEDQYNDVSHPNAQSKVGRDYDEPAKSTNDAMMLYGKVNKPRKDDSDEESDDGLDVGYDPRKSGVNVLPLYGVVNKNRSLARSTELDEADAGLY